jgi:flagellar motility protein MotE (MotC chaperone)
MIKFFGLILLAALVFVGTLAGALAATGNLSQEAIERLVKGPAESEAAPAPIDEAGPVLQALKKREEGLKQREAEVARNEELQRIQQSDLDGMKSEISEMLSQIKTSLETVDEKRDEQLTEVANSFAAMKARNAAEALEAWPAEDAADILRRVDEKDRGKILDEMEPTKASMILRNIQQPAF